MLKVILIDDEISTLRLLPRAIDWAALNLEICGTASDGEEGLRLFHRCAPDIIIVDIKMPRMDGLAFSRAVRESGHSVKIILLSAYAEFEFAQGALHLKISDYLLKPLDEEKLQEVLRRAIGEIEAERRPTSGVCGREFYDGERRKNALAEEKLGLAAIEPPDFAVLERGMTILAERGDPRQILTELDAILQSSFQRRTDPEKLFEFILDFLAQLKATLIRFYGYRSTCILRSIAVEQLRECAGPEMLLRLVHSLVDEAAVNLVALLADDQNCVVIQRAKGYVNEHYIAISDEQRMDEFATGKAAMTISGPWAISTFKQKNPQIDLGIMPFVGAGGEKYSIGALNVGVAIAAKTKNPAAAQAFVNYLGSKEGLALYQSVTGNFLGATGVNYKVDPVMETMKQYAATGNFAFPPVDWTFTGTIDPMVRKGLQEIVLGTKTPAQVVTEIENKIIELINP